MSHDEGNCVCIWMHWTSAERETCGLFPCSNDNAFIFIPYKTRSKQYPPLLQDGVETNPC
eukprot:9913329-Ditylum_brightwellii.AAC.1